MIDERKSLPRRDFLKLMGVVGILGGSAGAFADSARAARSSANYLKSEGINAAKDRYVYLSIVTQVPFWVDHKAALADFSKVTAAK